MFEDVCGFEPPLESTSPTTDPVWEAVGLSVDLFMFDRSSIDVRYVAIDVRQLSIDVR